MARAKRKTTSASKQSTSPAQPDAAQLAAEARALIESLSQHFRLAAVDELMDGLRRKRLFSDLAALGIALSNQGTTVSPKALRLTAQGLIELGRFKEAKEKLDAVITANSDPAEVLEARGLVGRLQKQIYVNQCFRSGKGEAALLINAANSYLAAFDENLQHPAWHGINAAALLNRAQRDGVRRLPVERAATIAGEIRETLVKTFSESTEYFDLATIAEACLVLGDADQAELWFHRAAWCKDANPFALASTIRQLREVWLLDPARPPGSRILPPLDARLHALGQTLMIAPTAAAQSNDSVPFEKVFGNSPFMPFQAWALALECAKSVCRVEDKLNQGLGTGFLIHGKSLHKSLPDELLLITNAHVLSPNGDDGSLTAAQAHVSFYANTDKQGRAETTRIKKILWSSPPGTLDATIARLEKRPPVKSRLAFALNLPLADSKQKVYVIGHPSGGGLMFSLNDNELLDHGDPNDPRVHYRTPTEPGSSGSPVFNSQWELIALHHAGDAALEKIHGAGKYQANEGIAFKHIAPAIRV